MQHVLQSAFFFLSRYWRFLYIRVTFIQKAVEKVTVSQVLLSTA